MISGVRGSGKTVMLSDIANEFSKKKNWIVINVYKSEDGNKMNFICNTKTGEEKTLDEKQIEVLEADDKYTLVCAGAGAGKTTTVAAKVKYLVDKKGVDPKHILVISLTNKAVEELNERIHENLEINCRICTFHSLGASIMNGFAEDKGHGDLLKQNELKDYVDEYIKEKIKENVFAEELLEYFVGLSDEEFDKWLKSYKEDNGDDASEIIGSLFDDNSNPWVEEFSWLIVRFVELFEINNYTEYNISEWIKGEEKDGKKSGFLRMFDEFYGEYNKFKTSNKKYTFSDMINKSIQYLDECLDEGKKGNRIPVFEYIIIDEYQDISQQRFDLIKRLVDYSDRYLPDGKSSHLIAVGDDWQAIYAFSGARIDLFTDFEEKIGGKAKQILLENTYRNRQGILDIAGKFIKKNTNQIDKTLHSMAGVGPDCPVKLIDYKEGAIKWALEKALIQIREDREKDNAKIESEKDRIDVNSPVFVLGRYSFEGRRFGNGEGVADLFDYDKGHIKWKKYPDMDIRFLTVHEAKGLECQDVILANCKNAEYGFPSQIKDNEILKYVSCNEEENKAVDVGEIPEYPEERRLFYVAMTRTKSRVYLLCPKEPRIRLIPSKWNTKRSVFIKELLEDDKNNEIEEIDTESEELELWIKEEKENREKRLGTLNWLAGNNALEVNESVIKAVIKDLLSNELKAESAFRIYIICVRIYEALSDLMDNNESFGYWKSTVIDYMLGKTTVRTTKERTKGEVLKDLDGFGFCKDIDKDELEDVIYYMLENGYIYECGWDSPDGQLLRYGGKQICNWNSFHMTNEKKKRLLEEMACLRPEFDAVSLGEESNNREHLSPALGICD